MDKVSRARYIKLMKPLYHPSAADITVEGILYALSDPVRAQIFAQIATSDCAHTCTSFSNLADRVLPKSTLSQHFKVLREAGLIRSERSGVELRNTARCTEIEERFGPLLATIVEAYRGQHKDSPMKRIV